MRNDFGIGCDDGSVIRASQVVSLLYRGNDLYAEIANGCRYSICYFDPEDKEWNEDSISEYCNHICKRIFGELVDFNDSE